jgi:hypothetical protein
VIPDEHLAIGAGQDRDIAARTFENADIATQLVNFYRRLGSIVADQFDDVAGLGIGLRGRQPAFSCSEDGGSATYAKAASR